MSTDTRVTLLDFVLTKEPDGSLAETVELMQQLAPILQDSHVMPANAPYGNRTTFRRSLPLVGTAKINKGVTRSKSATDQRSDVIGYFAGRSEVDSRIRKIEGDLAYARKRSDEDKSFEESLAQLVTNYFFYGDVKTDEAGFDGLHARMSTLNQGTDITASQVWSMAGGQAVVGSDGFSLDIVDWGERAACLIFPPKTVGSLDIQDLGDIPVNDSDGNSMQAGVTAYDWFIGLSVRDPRHIARLANADLSDSQLDTPLQGKIFDRIESILSLMPEPGASNRVIYCPLRAYSSFLKQARTVSNLALSMAEYLGKPTPHLWGYPLRRSDQMSTTESTVS